MRERVLAVVFTISLAPLAVFVGGGCTGYEFAEAVDNNGDSDPDSETLGNDGNPAYDPEHSDNAGCCSLFGGTNLHLCTDGLEACAQGFSNTADGDYTDIAVGSVCTDCVEAPSAPPVVVRDSDTGLCYQGDPVTRSLTQIGECTAVEPDTNGQFLYTDPDDNVFCRAFDDGASCGQASLPQGCEASDIGYSSDTWQVTCRGLGTVELWEGGEEGLGANIGTINIPGEPVKIASGTPYSFVLVDANQPVIFVFSPTIDSIEGFSIPLGDANPIDMVLSQDNTCLYVLVSNSDNSTFEIRGFNGERLEPFGTSDPLPLISGITLSRGDQLIFGPAEQEQKVFIWNRNLELLHEVNTAAYEGAPGVVGAWRFPIN